MKWIDVALATVLVTATVYAQPPAPVPSNPTTTELQTAADQAADAPGRNRPRPDTSGETPDGGEQLHQLRHAVVRLPLAAVLACALALRPRRKGTPKRQTPVIETQIILAIVGAVVMLVVGSSLARAFGIVGAANLIRYRSKIDDPKDAVVMLCALAVGLASGVGLYLLAGIATVFLLALLWVIESFQPATNKTFDLKITAENEAEGLRPRVEQVLKRFRLTFEGRSLNANELSYEVQMPFDAPTDPITQGIVAVSPKTDMGVEWTDKKPKTK